MFSELRSSIRGGLHTAYYYEKQYAVCTAVLPNSKYKMHAIYSMCKYLFKLITTIPVVGEVWNKGIALEQFVVRTTSEKF